MFKSSHKDYSYLVNILDAIRKIKSYIKDFSDADEWYCDSKSFDAVLMNFVLIGEMAEKLSEEFKDTTVSMIDWFRIRGFRNIIAHNYFGVDAEEVWQIIENSLPDLEQNIESILNS